MKKRTMNKVILSAMVILWFSGCVPQLLVTKNENRSVPAKFQNTQDTSNIAKINWKLFFNDPNLIRLIDTALSNNQELNIVMQEIEIGKNEIRARKGEYLPFVGLTGGNGVEKSGRYTRNGAVEKNIDIEPGKSFPDPLQDIMLGATATWELDVWKKLHNAKKSAVARYLSSIEGKNFLTTKLISEIASAYYELMALDNQLDIIQKNIEIQTSVLQVIKLEKEAAKVTQLAVNRFEAQLLHTQNLQYDLKQKVIETENEINFLLGRYPQAITRTSNTFNALSLDSLNAGVSMQLLENRPDIRRAELELTASKLDVQVAKANFYPSFRITAGAGLQAFNPVRLVNPESIIFSLAGDMVAPLINKNAIIATYNSSNSRQIQAVYNLEQTILNAVIEVNNQLAKIKNYGSSYDTKSNEVEILTKSTTISNNLFRSARADYMEVLLTQREALESKMELIEIKNKQLKAKVSLYQVLGGGWN